MYSIVWNLIHIFNLVSKWVCCSVGDKYDLQGITIFV